jgi:DNA-binding XRE family transcriptional regulator/mannose-6-phosphate isomerase-like protein (cupin superfamily)
MAPMRSTSPNTARVAADETSAREASGQAVGGTGAPLAPVPGAETANDSDTASVGGQLRQRRLARGISLRQFGRQLGVSASFLSQLETGKAQPSVATLFAVCAALEMSIDDLFAASRAGGDPAGPKAASPRRRAGQWPAASGDDAGDAESASPVVSPGQRRILQLDSGVTWERLTATTTPMSEFMFVRYEVGGSSTLDERLIRHLGREYGFVLRGALEVTLGFETYRLTAGDSISFDSSRPHRLTNVGDEPVEAIWFDQGMHPPS